MKTIFIINPMAGNKATVNKFIQQLKGYINSSKSDAQMYFTKSVGDAEVYVKQMIQTNPKMRFIACGGDGTLNEVLNGAINSTDAEVGVIPLGTGNDFKRNFCGDVNFYDFDAQINSATVKCDAIKYTTDINGTSKTGYCVNMFNIGFDCNVADMCSSLKKYPLIKGPLAYFIAIFVMLVKKKGADIKIELDGKKFHDGKLLLTSLANGCYCGGGIKSNPLAELSDGLINVNVIYNLSRLNFMSKLPFYMKGTHIKLKNIQKYIYNTKCKSLKITPKGGFMRLCTDGEISTAGTTVFEAVPDAFNFVVPCINKFAKEKTLV